VFCRPEHRINNRRNLKAHPRILKVTTFGEVWLAVFVVGFLVIGWFCIFRTARLVAMGRKNYEKNKFVQGYPFSNMVRKPAYRLIYAVWECLFGSGHY
jgi:hypothetical protein